MPRVGGKKYPYTPAGMAAADYAKKRKKKGMSGTAKRRGTTPARRKPKSRRGR